MLITSKNPIKFSISPEKLTAIQGSGHTYFSLYITIRIDTVGSLGHDQVWENRKIYERLPLEILEESLKYANFTNFLVIPLDTKKGCLRKKIKVCLLISCLSAGAYSIDILPELSVDEILTDVKIINNLTATIEKSAQESLSYEVQAGDSIEKVAKIFLEAINNPNTVSINQMKVAIQLDNPHAFMNQNMHELRADNITLSLRVSPSYPSRKVAELIVLASEQHMGLPTHEAIERYLIGNIVKKKIALELSSFSIMLQNIQYAVR